MVNNQVQVFNNEHFGEIRIFVENDGLSFVAKDVCQALSLDPSQIRRLDEDEKGLRSIQTPGGLQDMVVVTESGLYSLVLGSRKPEAKTFKRWITHEVIPSIRKHGAYMTQEVIEKTLTNPDFIIQLATQLKDEREKRKLAEKKIEEQKPLVTFAETCIKSKDNILVRELAKIAHEQGMDIGEKKLYKKLREWGMVLKHSTEPSQRHVNSGYFVVEEGNVNTAYGVKLTKTTKVTPKGQIYIIEKLKQEQ